MRPERLAFMCGKAARAANFQREEGKITFSVSGQDVKATKKLKRGKASFQLPSTLAAGTYKVKAKVKGGGKAKRDHIDADAFQTLRKCHGVLESPATIDAVH